MGSPGYLSLSNCTRNQARVIMLKVENNLGDLTPSPSAFLFLLSHRHLFFLLPLLSSTFCSPLSPPLSFTFSLPLPPEWPDAGNFTTVDLFTFLQSWEYMNIYEAGLLLWGICLYSLRLPLCVHASVHNIHNIVLNCWILCVHQPYILCVKFCQRAEKM